jgi:putative NADH-flavin reductase
MKKKIAVLGATGRTGRWIVKEALDRGYAVNALVRSKSRLAIQHPDLTVVEGVPTSAKDLILTMQGCEAVLSALNIPRKKEWWPWSELSASPTFLSDVARKLVSVAKEMEIRRILVVSAWGTLETKEDLPTFFRMALDHTQIGPVYLDHERQEKVWEASGLNWTIVRPVGLLNDTAEKPLRVLTQSTTEKPKLTVSRRMVARFMLDCLEHNHHSRQKPIVSYL